MVNKKYSLLLSLLLLLLSVSSVCAADTNTCYNGVDYSNGYAYGHINGIEYDIATVTIDGIDLEEVNDVEVLKETIYEIAAQNAHLKVDNYNLKENYDCLYNDYKVVVDELGCEDKYSDNSDDGYDDYESSGQHPSSSAEFE